MLGPEIGPQVKGLVVWLLPQKPASPVPTTPTHAEVVARLHELDDSEKKVSKKVEEAKGRLETARAKVMEAEEGMAKVDGELQGIQDQIQALLKEEEDRKERRRKGGGGWGVMIWKTLLLLKKQAALRKLGFGWRLGRGGRLPSKGDSLGVGGAREVAGWMLRR